MVERKLATCTLNTYKWELKKNEGKEEKDEEEEKKKKKKEKA